MKSLIYSFSGRVDKLRSRHTYYSYLWIGSKHLARAISHIHIIRVTGVRLIAFVNRVYIYSYLWIGSKHLARAISHIHIIRVTGERLIAFVNRVYIYSYLWIGSKHLARAISHIHIIRVTGERLIAFVNRVYHPTWLFHHVVLFPCRFFLRAYGNYKGGIPSIPERCITRLEQ